MKKLSVLLSMLVVFGFASIASAQVQGSSYRYLSKEGQNAYRKAEQARKEDAQKKAEAAKEANDLVNKIKTKGKEVPISYTYISGNSVKKYSQNGQVKGWVYATWREDTKNYISYKDSYILLNESDWKAMLDECVPDWFTRAVTRYSKKISHKLKAGDEDFIKHGSGLLNNTPYEVGGKKYVVIEFHEWFRPA